MMSLFFRHCSHPVHKIQGLLEVGKPELAAKVMLIRGSPLSDVAEQRLQFFSLQGRYSPTAGNTLFVSELFSHRFSPVQMVKRTG